MFLTAVSSAQMNKVKTIQWQKAGELPALAGTATALGVAGPVAGVHGGLFLVAGGANFPEDMPWNGGKKKYHEEIYVFRKAGDSLLHHVTTKLPFAIAYAASVSLPGGILAIGGENENGLSNGVFLLQWKAELNKVTVMTFPSLPFAVTNASAAIHGNKVYVAGGERANDVSAELLVLDIENPEAGWKNLPALPSPTSHAVMVVQDNGKKECIYLVGGRKRNPGGTSDLYASVWQFDLQAKQWKERRSMPYALSAGTGTSIGDHQVVIFGGDAGDTFHKVEGLIAAIAKENDEQKRKQLIDEKARVQSSHPGFCGKVLVYDTKQDKWQEKDCMPFNVPVTTTAVTWNGAVFLPSGEIRAGIRTPLIMLGMFK